MLQYKKWHKRSYSDRIYVRIIVFSRFFNFDSMYLFFIYVYRDVNKFRFSLTDAVHLLFAVLQIKN